MDSEYGYNMEDFRQLSLLNVTEELEMAKAISHRAKRLSFEEIEIPAQFEINRTLLNEVVNQGRCGSCYALTVANSIESYMAIQASKAADASFKPVSLSAQQIIDCTRNTVYGNYGCRGGSVRSSFEYARDEGLMLERDYRYTGRQSFSCKAKSGTTRYGVSDMRFIGYRNTNYMIEVILRKGPVLSYVSGYLMRDFVGTSIFDDDLCKQRHIDHVVLITGYGTDNGVDYWIIKNTWGRFWGDEGYAKIRRGRNTCNIESLMYYPIL